MALIITGCSALIYILGGFFQLIAEGELNRALGKHRMSKQIKELRNHVIVCGFGRIGKVLAQRLKESGVEVVVVDADERRATQAAEAGYFSFQGDASHDATLENVGIARAQCLCTVLPNDAMNVFITLSARNLDPRIKIIARGEDPETEPKLKQAGANQVVLPSATSARRMSDMITRPTVLEYLEGTKTGGLDSELEVMGLTMLTLPLDESAANHTVGDLEKEAQVSLMVIAPLRASGETLEGPGLNEPLAGGDNVVLLVHPEHAGSLSISFASPRRRMLSYRGAKVEA
jgi:voltage-gated potassium channel